MYVYMYRYLFYAPFVGSIILLLTRLKRSISVEKFLSPTVACLYNYSIAENIYIRRMECVEVLCVVQVCLEGEISRGSIMAGLQRGQRASGSLPSPPNPALLALIYIYTVYSW
jgi:hypothetical protein